jgi:TetR/AcrR family transcriptional repressor of nem operon
MITADDGPRLNRSRCSAGFFRNIVYLPTGSPYPPIMTRSDTADLLLDAAQELIQKRGHNSFSYKDLAAVVDIRTASIHYHFPTKADLGEALVERYLESLEVVLIQINSKARSSKAKLKRFMGLYKETESRGCICLCGSLASDIVTLPEPVQKAVSRYLDRSRAWIANTLSEGVKRGEFKLAGKPVELASALLASLQGSLVISRALDGPSIVDQVQRTFMHSLQTS